MSTKRDLTQEINMNVLEEVLKRGGSIPKEMKVQLSADFLSKYYVMDGGCVIMAKLKVTQEKQNVEAELDEAWEELTEEHNYGPTDSDLPDQLRKVLSLSERYWQLVKDENQH